MSDNDTRREQIVRAWEDAWDRGETAGMEALLSPDYRRITATNQDGENREQFLAVIQTTREAFPDLTTVVDEIVIEGDHAAIRWHSGGTHLRPSDAPRGQRQRGDLRDLPGRRHHSRTRDLGPACLALGAGHHHRGSGLTRSIIDRSDSP